MQKTITTVSAPLPETHSKTKRDLEYKNVSHETLDASAPTTN